MKKSGRYTGSRRVLGLVLTAVLASAITGIPAGSGNLGRTSTSGFAGNGTLSGGTVSVTIGTAGPFTQTVTSGELISTVRNLLVAQIDADPNLAATVTVDPNDPNSNSFTVTTQSGAEIGNMRICETEPNIQNAGVSFAMGKDVAMLNKPTLVNGNGNYVLAISTWDHGTFTRTFDTTSPPNNTAAGLTTSIMASFTSAGFLVANDGTNLSFKYSTDMVTALRASSTDTGSSDFCIDMLKTVSPATVTSSSGIPTATEVGMIILVLLITGSAIWMLRRKPAAERPRS